MRTATAQSSIDIESDLRFQSEMLQKVSQTYAMTIPMLPVRLQDVVVNGYLLCRIADSIEDDRDMSLQDKEKYLARFSAIVAGELASEPFASDLASKLGPTIPDIERDLVSKTEQVIRVTLSFGTRQRDAMARCIRTMSEGMIEFQQYQGVRGLNDLPHLDRYCYFVAGVVGEMLSELFCAYSSEVDRNHSEIRRWSVICGKGVQLTNIIKDIWDDRRKGMCWLPRDLFLESGFDLCDLSADQSNPGFGEGLLEMIAIAKYHLNKGLEFALAIPSNETRIRRHIVSSLGLSVLVLRKIHFSESFTRGQDIKLSKLTVMITIGILNLLVRSDFALKAFYFMLTRPLPNHILSDTLSA